MHRRESLEELNVSWCRGVPEPWLGVLADACSSLRMLTVFGCSQVRTLFGVPCEVSLLPIASDCMHVMLTAIRSMQASRKIAHTAALVA